jgi:transcriptional regulator with XRE-family HTH domain
MEKNTLSYKDQTPAQRWSIICREEREKRYWVRRQMANYFNVVTSTITFWEQAKSYPKNEYIYKMAELKQVTPNSLINWLNNTVDEKECVQQSLLERTLSEAEALSDNETADLITALVAMLVSKKIKSNQLTLNF